MLPSDLLRGEVQTRTPVGSARRHAAAAPPDDHQHVPTRMLGLVVSPRMRSSYLGYERTNVNAPQLLVRILGWRHRGTFLAAWEDVARRCRSIWNVLCTVLYTSALIAANPMPLVGRPKIAKTLPKSLPPRSVAALLPALDAEPQRRRSDWIERDRALILPSLLAGLRADELLRANVGDVRGGGDGTVIHIRGKGGKDRRIPIEPILVAVFEDYLDSRLAPVLCRGQAALLPRRGTVGLAAGRAAVRRRRPQPDHHPHLA